VPGEFCAREIHKKACEGPEMARGRRIRYGQLAVTGKVARNPHGPATSLDPTEPGVMKRVQRGGSFLCTSQYCSRYIVGTRGKGEVSSATNHVGFRCVKDRPVAQAAAQARECPTNRRALLLRVSN
jgi:hypothetical protein